MTEKKAVMYLYKTDIKSIDPTLTESQIDTVFDSINVDISSWKELRRIIECKADQIKECEDTE